LLFSAWPKLLEGPCWDHSLIGRTCYAQTTHSSDTELPVKKERGSIEPRLVTFFVSPHLTGVLTSHKEY